MLKILWWAFFWIVQAVGTALSLMIHNWLLLVWCLGWGYYGLCRFTRELEVVLNKTYHQP